MQTEEIGFMIHFNIFFDILKRKSCMNEITNSQRQTNVFSLSRQVTDRQMFKEKLRTFQTPLFFY